MADEPRDLEEKGITSLEKNTGVIDKRDDEKVDLIDSKEKIGGIEEREKHEVENSILRVEELGEKTSESERVMEEGENGVKEAVDDDSKDKVEESQNKVMDVENALIIDKPSNYPDFATIFSFLSLFGGYLELPDVTILDLEQLLSLNYQLSTDKDSLSVLELVYLKLFRRLNKSQRFSYLGNVTAERLERTMAKFSYQLKFNHADKLAISGYRNLSIEERLVILKNLCEVQFEDNLKFRALFQDVYKGDSVLELRLQPFGVEQNGFFIWYQEDKECNVRVYAGGCANENIDEWQVRASSSEDLEQYISQLKLDTEVNPKDTAAARAEELKVIKEKEKEQRRLEREARRKAELEKKKNEKRKSRRSKKQETIISSTSSEEEDDDDGCIKCQKNHEDDLVLLCDGCDAGYHASCLLPPLMSIPEGDWFCPYCQQVELVKNLQQKLTELKTKLKAKERKSRRLQFYGIRQANILNEEVEGGSRRARSKVDYKFSEFDRILDDAVRSSEEDSLSSKPRRTNGVSRTSSGRVTKKRYTLSADEASDSDDDYMGSESTGSGGRSDDFIVSDDYDEMEERHRNKYLRRSKRTTAKYSSANRSRRKRRRRNRYDSDEDDSEGDEESDYGPRRSSRIKRKGTNVKYDELYGSDLDEEETGKNLTGKDDDDYKKESESEVEELEEDISDKSEGDESGSDTSNCFVAKRSKKQIIESDESEDDEEEEVDEKIEETKEKSQTEKGDGDCKDIVEISDTMETEKSEDSDVVLIQKTSVVVNSAKEGRKMFEKENNFKNLEQVDALNSLEKIHESQNLENNIEISTPTNLEQKSQAIPDSKDTKPFIQNETFPTDIHGVQQTNSPKDGNSQEASFVNGTNKLAGDISSQTSTPKHPDIANTDSKTAGFRPYNSNPSAMEIKKHGIPPQPPTSSQMTHPSHPSRRLPVYQPRHSHPQQAIAQQIHRPQQMTNPTVPSSLPTYYETNSLPTHNRFPMYHHQQHYPYPQQQQQQPQYLQNQSKPQIPVNTYGNSYQSVPTRSFYGSGMASHYQNQWTPQHPSVSPHSRWAYQAPQNNFIREQASEEVKKKGRDKETKSTVKRTTIKQGNKTIPNQNEATRSMNYFRNMVISPDNDNVRYQDL